MTRDLERFLKRTSEGQSSLNEFFLSLCRTAGVPPLPRYEAECERLLTERHLLNDGIVPVVVPKRKWPPRATKYDRSSTELNDRPHGYQLS
jgi:hypothetical protein